MLEVAVAVKIDLEGVDPGCLAVTQQVSGDLRGSAVPDGGAVPVIVLNSTRKLIRVGIGSRPAVSHARRKASRRSASWATGNGVGCHTAAKRAARRSAASLAPPIQIGGCGCCTGLGLTCMLENEKNLPAKETLPGAQQACQRRRYSLVR